LRGVVPNKILQLVESQNIWSPPKLRAGYASARGPVLKITFGLNSVLTLQNILIVNTKIV